MKLIKLAHWSILVSGCATFVLAIVLLGCPDPRSELYFRTDGRVIQEPKLRLGPVSLKMAVHGDYYNGKYKVGLGWEYKSSARSGRLEFNPCTMDIWVAGHHLSYQRAPGALETPDCWEDASGLQHFIYGSDITPNDVPQDSTGRWLPLPVTIYLGKAFRIDGNLVPMDTLHAVDKKTEGIRVPWSWR